MSSVHDTSGHDTSDLDRPTMTRSTLSSYDEDFFAWTQDQAAALRRLPRGAPQNDLDLDHLAEEIEDLGRRDLREVTSLLSRVLEHLIKITDVPASRDVAHWHGEAIGFQIAAADAFSPSMRRLIDMARVWRQARRRANATLEQMGAAMSAPEACPFTLGDLLAEDFEVTPALRKLEAGR